MEAYCAWESSGAAGHNSLRAGINFAKDHSYNRAILSVNADNEKATSSHIQEEFKEVESVVFLYYGI
ncbi:hypothetical protein E8P77_20125 [Soehngenia saccharolytica]|nr:hypothetical protein E8P77_20125 [Soehngenia saccharolytica]